MNSATSPTRTHVAIEGVSKAFDGIVAVDNVDLCVERGHTLALLGPSGCGKTTLLRMIAGLETPDSGTITIGDRLVFGGGTDVRPQKRGVGMVFQTGALFPHMSVGENIAYGLGKSPDASRVDRALQLVDLEGYETRSVSTLSGGQQQRVALARALAPEPDVILLDEPLGALDAELRVRLRTEVAALLHRLDITTIFVTHDQEEAFVVGDKAAVMRGGRVLQMGTPEEIYQQPVDAWVARFVGDANLVLAAASGKTAETKFGPIPLAQSHSGACVVVVRPEFLHLTEGTQARIDGIEFYGHDTSYRLMIDGERVTVRGLADPRFSPGARVDVHYSGPPAAAFADSPLVAAE
ncbi:MAG: ABC transporter ATP-binding protein [Acidimicrobiia bacterium]|nr:ABC transporter ATP-binding protein [Acidimicrobiia bacterium]